MMRGIPDTDDSGNGTIATYPPRFSQPVLRRLLRLHSRAQAAQEIAQQTSQYAQAVAGQFQEALAEACEDLGVPLPRTNVEAHIDWRTGEFEFEPTPTQ